MMAMLQPVFKTFLLALTGGGVFYLLHIPLAWLLGPMTILLVCREVLGWRGASWPTSLQHTGLTLLGYMMGCSFTTEVAIQIVRQLPSMAAATLLTVACAMGIGWITAHRTGISMTSALLGSIPGGLSQMVALCSEYKDADITVTTFMQTIRLMSVIFIVPFLAVHGFGGDPQTAVQAAASVSGNGGEWLSLDALWCIIAVGVMLFLAPRLHLPTPYLLGPMLAAAILSVLGVNEPLLPNIGIIAAQIFVGAYMGVSTSLSSLSNWRRLLPYAFLGGVGIVAFSLGVGFLLTLWHPMSFATAFLGAAPGGMTEMGLTGAAVGADMSIIVAYQMFRILFILFVVPYIVKGLLRIGNNAISPERNFDH